MILKANEVKEATSEELIQALVYTGIKIAYDGGKASKALYVSEKRVVKELSERFNLNAVKLMGLLSK